MKELIARTFEHCFDQFQFEIFIKNLFNEIALVPAPIAIPSGADEHITNITFLAEYTDERNAKIDVLVVKLPTTTKVERARSFQRNLIAKYLKDNVKDAALVAFYTEAAADWRLSFIKVEYKVTDRGVKVEAGTPPKRFSFLVGEGEPSHTAQTQLFPILKEQKTNPCVFDIEDAFGVEKVTKEFYDNYRQLYDRLTHNLQKNHAFQAIVSKQHIVIEDFAKKLLGQIVFLYFLQKKGWIGVPQGKNWGEGDKFFLQTIFKKAKEKKENFYNNYLEPLFYDTLNNSRRDEVDPSYSRLFECKIPFLNGGLFDPEYDWRNTFVNLNDAIFEDILAVFDLYNFTVKEDEPLEKEVAVDPEMLGKVFENLLPENLRKGRGAYYTPREIVHYMCQESLANHLSTETGIAIEKLRNLISFKDVEGNIQLDISLSKDEAIKIEHALTEVRVCDPACGSGAFLVGMLNEIVGLRHSISGVLDEEGERSEYRLKKQAIQNCIYGVDIDPGAVDIAKLRLWLTLVVDYKLQDIEPLPNLDYKIMCGNSLLEGLVVGDESIQLFDSKLLSKAKKINRDELQKELKAKREELSTLYSKWKPRREQEKKIVSEINAIENALGIKRNSKPRKKPTIKDDLMSLQGFLFEQDPEEYFNALRGLHIKYFSEYDLEAKKQLRNQIESIELLFIKNAINIRVKDIDVRMRNLNMQLPEHRKQQAGLMGKKLEFLAIPNEIHRSKVRPYFLWKLNFFEVFKDKGGFDIVIANPPYVGQKGNKDLFEIMKGTPYFEKKMDYWYFFLHRAHDLNELDGITTFITPNYWITAGGGRKLRRRIVDDFKLIEWINFNDNNIFEAGVHTNVFVLRKSKQKNSTIKCTIYNNKYEDDFIHNKNKQLNFTVDQNIIYQAWTKFIHFLPEKILNIISKLILNSEKLCDASTTGKKKAGVTAGKHLTDGICNLNQGLVTGKDRHIDKIANITAGVFVINEGEKNNFDKSDFVRLKEFYKNSDISQYYASNTPKYFLIYVNDINSESELSKYKSIYAHLLKFKDNLSKRSINGVLQSAYKKGKWWALTTDRPNINFDGEKILCPQRSKINTFGYSDSAWYASADVYYISLNKKSYFLKYILAILNSALIYFWLYYMGKRKGEMLELYLEPLQFIPIKKIPADQQRPFVNLVDEILNISRNNSYLNNHDRKKKVREYKRQIDQLVYKLYDIDQAEISIVESHNNSYG